MAIMETIQPTQPSPRPAPHIAASTFPAQFDQVSPSYRHQQKWAQPAPALLTETLCLKWYVVYPAALPISEAQLMDAQAFLRGEVEAGRLALQNEVGFVVLHRCATVLIIYACTWRNDNEVWETLYHKDLTADAPTADAPYQRLRREDTSPTFCVWVLPAVLHEQGAWVRYLQSPRDAAAQAAYLGDQLTGWV